MNKSSSLIMASIIAMSLPVMASAATSTHAGYLTDSEGAIVRDSSGACWHTRYWTPAMAVAGCDHVTDVSEVTHAPIHAMEIMPAQTSKTTKPAPAQAMLEQPKLVRKNVNFADEDLFKFNKAVLNPNGKAVLDTLVRDLHGVQYDVIHVTGYTDRIGGAKYNKRLSLHRARAVKNYLVKQGIPAGRIEAEGMGKTHPITRYADCRGLSRAKTIACLQPDRRTEVAVTGTETVPTNQKLSSLSSH
jgi:OOP family OmpA-OmpF porin